MRVVVQRVSKAVVTIDGKISGEINAGLMVLVGFCDDDNKIKVDWMCAKLLGLRVFSDYNDKMNLSVKDINGEILIVSNFTLYGEVNKGTRPNFSSAAKPDMAIPLYEYMIEVLRLSGVKIETGIFGAMMDVSLTNDGPVTIVIDK